MSGNQNASSSSPQNQMSTSEKLSLTRIALAVGLIVQFGTGVWYAALAFSELGDHARRIAILETSQSTTNAQIQTSLQAITLQLASLSQKVADLKDSQSAGSSSLR